MARTAAEVRRAQRLRYAVFYEEMSASPSLTARLLRRDEDHYDAVCDHLLVIDHEPPSDGAPGRTKPRPEIVGTYRVLLQQAAERTHGFYTQGEYDIQPLIDRRPNAKFMELGRSCVLKPYRTKRTVELLWHGLWAYVRENKVDVMVGCASFQGTDPAQHAMALSFLYHNALAPQPWRVRAHDHLRIDMAMLDKSAVEPRAALKQLPPLIKAYLRLGAYVGDGAVVDRQFGTTDVLIILPVEAIDPRYFEHFGAPDEVGTRVGA